MEAVLDHAEGLAEKPALIAGNTGISYRELAGQVRRMAGLLSREYHVAAGGRVMLTGLSDPAYIIALLAAQYLHAVTVPTDKVWTEETVLRLYDFIRPDLMLTDMAFRRTGLRTASLKELYRRSAAEGAEEAGDYTRPAPEAVAEMLFTTGTTGMPKGVMLTYDNIRVITENNREGTGFAQEDVLLNALPLCHSLGLRQVRLALSMGATLVIQNGFAFPRVLRENIERHRCTAFVCVPATMVQLTRSIKDFPELFGHFRLIEIGAGSLSLDLKKRLPKMLPGTRIVNTWGSSETGGVIFLDVSGRQDKIAALGAPVPTAEVKVIDDAGAEKRATDPEHAGRLAIRGGMTMAGYYEMPEINRETLVDGWLRTNDLVYTDDEGFVYMLGRADDLINTGGEKVSPLEIENAASEYPEVLDAACIGVPDPVMGQAPVLYVAAEEPFSADDLRRFLSGRLETFKIPTRIIRIDEIPRNRMKKLDRKAVRRIWDEGEQGATEQG